MEPQLCGCAEIYLNLGCFYDAEGLGRMRPKLLALQRENQALYPAVYAELNAAAALEECARQSMQRADPEGLYRLMRTMCADLSPAREGSGQVREVFLRAYTPKGLTDLTDSACAQYRTRIAVYDPCGLSAPLFQRLTNLYRHAGHDCINVLSPLDPGRPEGLIVPEANMAFLACQSSENDCAVTVNLRQFFRDSEQTKALMQQAGEHCARAISALSRAKALHDKIEAVYHPFVSFEGLDLLTQEYQKTIRTQLLRA